MPDHPKIYHITHVFDGKQIRRAWQVLAKQGWLPSEASIETSDRNGD